LPYGRDGPTDERARPHVGRRSKADPRTWIHEVERPHELLQAHGDAALRTAASARYLNVPGVSEVERIPTSVDGTEAEGRVLREWPGSLWRASPDTHCVRAVTRQSALLAALDAITG